MTDILSCWQRTPTKPMHLLTFRKDGIKLYAVGMRSGIGICHEEILYAHFMKRKITVLCQDKEHYIIVPNSIIPDRVITRTFLLFTALRPEPYIAYWKKRIYSKCERLFKKYSL